MLCPKSQKHDRLKAKAEYLCPESAVFTSTGPPRSGLARHSKASSTPVQLLPPTPPSKAAVLAPERTGVLGQFEFGVIQVCRLLKAQPQAAKNIKMASKYGRMEKILAVFRRARV
jgi:hypothetical protein